jgi:trigger factor
VAVKIPNIIIEQEVDRLLSQTLDEVKRLGLTLDQYLASTGRNIDALRAEYQKKAETDIKLEFVLQKIAETEGIKVEDKEIDEAIAQAKTDAERQNLQNNRYLLAGIIRQQKTLSRLGYIRDG